ncbi:MAG: hypothetical protein Q4B63_07355 [Clostridium perfringens]|nr:hypothetical protein [Clostridium perfringens]
MNIEREIEKIWLNYDKLNYYNALTTCNKILSKYPYFEEILEIKAYILYINGYLEESSLCWEMNYSENNNNAAKFCLDNMKNYKNLESLYKEALNDIKNKKLNSALDKLITCSHSDFNKIPVGNAIEKCNLLKLGVLPKDINIGEPLVLEEIDKIFKISLLERIKVKIKNLKNNLKIKLSPN